VSCTSQFDDLDVRWESLLEQFWLVAPRGTTRLLFVLIILAFIFYLDLTYVGAFCHLLNKRILYCVVSDQT